MVCAMMPGRVVDVAGNAYGNVCVLSSDFGPSYDARNLLPVSLKRLLNTHPSDAATEQTFNV